MLIGCYPYGDETISSSLSGIPFKQRKDLPVTVRVSCVLF